jgi:hypothetical protein
MGPEAFCEANLLKDLTTLFAEKALSEDTGGAF